MATKRERAIVRAGEVYDFARTSLAVLRADDAAPGVHDTHAEIVERLWLALHKATAARDVERRDIVQALSIARSIGKNRSKRGQDPDVVHQSSRAVLEEQHPGVRISPKAWSSALAASDIKVAATVLLAEAGHKVSRATVDQLLRRRRR